MTSFDDLAGRLDEIAEELADLALEHLQAALGAGDDDEAMAEAKAAERRLTRARRRIVEAAQLLRG